MPMPTKHRQNKGFKRIHTEKEWWAIVDSNH